MKQWLIGRKFGMSIGLCAVVCIGGVWMYWNTVLFSERLQVFNDTMEWLMYVLLSFCGVEGTLDAMREWKRSKEIISKNEP